MHGVRAGAQGQAGRHLRVTAHRDSNRQILLESEFRDVARRSQLDVQKPVHHGRAQKVLRIDRLIRVVDRQHDIHHTVHRVAPTVDQASLERERRSPLYGKPPEQEGKRSNREAKNRIHDPSQVNKLEPQVGVPTRQSDLGTTSFTGGSESPGQRLPPLAWGAPDDRPLKNKGESRPARSLLRAPESAPRRKMRPQWLRQWKPLEPLWPPARGHPRGRGPPFRRRRPADGDLHRRDGPPNDSAPEPSSSLGGECGRPSPRSLRALLHPLGLEAIAHHRRPLRIDRHPDGVAPPTGAVGGPLRQQDIEEAIPRPSRRRDPFQSPEHWIPMRSPRGVTC